MASGKRLVYDRKCSECGKEFRIYDYKNYAYMKSYKRKLCYCCSYTCFNKLLKKIDDEKKARKGKIL